MSVIKVNFKSSLISSSKDNRLERRFNQEAERIANFYDLKSSDSVDDMLTEFRLHNDKRVRAGLTEIWFDWALHGK